MGTYDEFGYVLSIDTAEKVSNLEKAFDDAKNRNVINKQRLKNGEGIPCRICHRIYLPEQLSDMICSTCSRIINQISCTGWKTDRVEKMAFAIRIHEETMRRLSE